MNDSHKTKAQLIKELEAARRRVAALENRLSEPAPGYAALQHPTGHEQQPDFTGREVSCRALGVLFQKLQEKDLPPETLTAGVTYPLELLRNKHERIDWDSYCTIAANAGKIWSDEELVNIGSDFIKSPWFRPVGLVARLLYTAKEFYIWTARPSLDSNRDFTCIEPSVKELGSDRLELVAHMKPGYKLCREYFLITKGVLAAMPTLLSLRSAQIEMIMIEAGARYLIQAPQGGGVLAWLRRAVTWPFTVRAAAHELQESYKVLQLRYLELKRVEQAFRESEARLNAAQERGKLGSWEYNAVTREGRWSRQMYRLYYRDLALGPPTPKAFIDLIHPDDRQQVRQTQQEILETGVAKTVEYRTNPSNGPIRTLSAVTEILEMKEGQVIALAGTVLDITERKQAEQALQAYSENLEEMVETRTEALSEAQERLHRQEKLAILGQLAGGVAHELRNPLGVISNAIYYLQLVLTDADEDIIDYMNLIDIRIKEADKIISDLLNLSRTQPTERNEHPISGMIEHTLTRHPPPTGIMVTVELGADLPLAFVDPQQIWQVLTNLVTNAYQAMPEGGALTFRAETEPGWVHLLISDTGQGLVPEIQQKIFEPLFTTKTKGFGLGLAVSKNLVEVNGGRLEVTSQAGQGSTFIVTLPRKAALPSEAARPTEAARPIEAARPTEAARSTEAARPTEAEVLGEDLG